MSYEAQLAYLNKNPLLLPKLAEGVRTKILESELKWYKAGINYDEIERNDNTETLKQKQIFNRYTIHTGELLSQFKELKNVEMLKFAPPRISEIYHLQNDNANLILDSIISNISKYPNMTNLSNFLLQLKNTFDYDPMGRNEDLKSKEILARAIKLTLNDDILGKVDETTLKEYLENPTRESLLDIVEKAYGKQSRKILEDRPMIDIDNIPNFHIFNPIVIEEFSIGTIHNFLSYNSRGPMIMSDLVRYPEKMKLYKRFDQITNGYFEETALGEEEKLKTFYELSSKIGEENLVEMQKENLLLLIGDMHCSKPINLIELGNTSNLENYAQIREEKFNEAIEKLTDSYDIKDLIYKKFFGLPYRIERNDINLQEMDIVGMKNFYNIDKFVNDSRTLNSGQFTEDELDTIELVSIIDKINDSDILKQLNRELSEEKDIVINPIDFKKTIDKIPQQYSKELVKELLTPEKAKKMVEEGVEGISYEERDGIIVIKLTGADFLIYSHQMGMNLSECSSKPQDEYKLWTEYEEGVSTISGTLTNQEYTRRCKSYGNPTVGFFKINPNQILGMGTDDIGTSHGKRNIDTYFGFSGFGFDYPDNILKKTKEGPSLKEYCEVVSYRRERNPKEIKEGTYGGRIMPDFILTEIGRTDDGIRDAKKFGANVVIEIDDNAYDEKKLSKNIDKTTTREKTEFMKKIERIINDDERE